MKTNTKSSGSPSLLQPISHRRSARISAKSKETVIDFDSADSGSIAKKPSVKRRKLNGARSSSLAQANDNTNMPPLIDLGKFIRGTLVKRPSASIRSPYVADVALFKGKKKSTTIDSVLAHAPSLDVGGMCVSGSEVYLSERNGEGKTSHSIELVRGAPLTKTSTADSNDNDFSEGVLVGAHPRLGELIAEEVLKRGLLQSVLPLQKGFELRPVNDIYTAKTSSPKKQRAKKGKQEAKNDDDAHSAAVDKDGNSTSKTKISLRRQVTLGDSRVDFQMTLDHPLNNSLSHRVIFEVKNVVCADYEAGTEPIKTGPGHCVVVAPPISCSDEDGKAGYKRSALFPWGRTRGQDFEGKKVVSERACKHLRNLQSLLNEDVTTVVLFIVNRSDCESVRACDEKCPVFAEVLRDVVKAGVRALAVRVMWTEDGECHFDGVVPVTV